MSKPATFEPMQWSKPVMTDLRRERRRANFDIWDLTQLIYGGQENLKKVEDQVKLVMAEPRLQADDLWYINRQERYYRACERARIFVKIVRENRIPFEERGPLEMLLGEDLFILLHDVMFLPSLINLADEEQQSWWLEKALNYEYVGTYAQTELTHGSNVRGMGTQAVWDGTLYNGDGGWRVHTPSLEAMKWWPGGMAKSCNCVILMARVIIKGKDYGPHPFFFQVEQPSDFCRNFAIRDWNTHATLPGLELRDIGQKLGYNGMDNGGLYITEAIIPRRNLLMKFVNVDRDGNYKKVGNQKMLFGTMTYTRLKISSSSGVHLAKAVTTAVRYSAVRRQFQMQRVQLGSDDHSANFGEENVVSQLQKITKPSKRSEAQILDYSSQQFLIFPQLALSFALHFSGLMAGKLYDIAIREFRGNKFDKLQEMHCLTSTLKAVNTMLAVDGMEQCRKSLGGHGYLNCAGVGPNTMSVLPQATYEGDFVVLSIQVGQVLLGAVTAKMMKGKKTNPHTPLLQYIYDFDPMAEHKPPTVDELEEQKLLENHDFLFDCLKRRANWMHYSTAEVFQEAVMAAGGKIGPNTLDEVKIEMMRMTYSHAYVMYALAFRETLAEASKTVQTALNPLYQLYCLTVIDSGYDKGGGLGDFIACGALPGGDRKISALITKEIKKCLQMIRPQAVALVDGWNFPDFLLNSVLGRYDGRVYEALYEQTKKEPLNKRDITDGYYDHLQYMIHPERETNPNLVQTRGDVVDQTAERRKTLEVAAKL
ncbi:unnamed protein product [Amoebophrya sp. A120]|nr:unnamed protein product [Amoebophrya sp. A120]|eukprot:GSA120T00022878001.1